MNGVGRGDDKEKKGKFSVVTRETAGMTLLLFGAILFLIAVTGPYLFGDIGVAITAFFIGIFGFAVYPLLLLLIYLSSKMVFGKKPVPVKWILRIAFLALAVFFIVHTATAERFYGNGFGAYLSGCWGAAAASAGAGTGGGVVLGLIVYPVRALLYPAGAYVVFSVLLLLSLFVLALGMPLKAYVKFFARERARNKKESARISADKIKTEGVKTYPQPLGFDDLSVPERAPVPAAAAVAEPAPVPVRAEMPAEQKQEDARDILFRRDPAKNYRDNLIFYSDSRFNSQPRKSSVLHPERAQGSDPANKSEEILPPPSYSDRYSAQAETQRASMPRRVTESRTETESGYSYSASELNYPQAPTYRAREEAPKPARDFYKNDVPAEEFSSAPHIDDVPAEAEPEARKEESARELPVRESSVRDFTVRESVREMPVKPEPKFGRESVLPSRETAEPAFRSPRIAEMPAPEEEKKSEERPDLSISSLFSRRSPERPVPTERPARPMGFGGEENAPSPKIAEPVPEEEKAEETSRVFGAPVPDRTDSTLFDDDADEGDYREILAQPDPEPEQRTRAFSPRERSIERPRLERESVRHEIPVQPPVPDTPALAPQKHVYKEYRRPSLDLFAQYDDAVKVSAEEIERNSAIIEETLAGFRIDAQVTDTTPSSAVTRYDIDIPGNISVSAVIKHDKELAMRLHSRDGVNMYVNNSNGRIAVEVPNTVRATVGLKSVMQADNYVNAKPNALMFALGNDVENVSICENIVKMTHVLVAGSTNSGKSVCLNAMLVSLICKYSPEDLRLILIDPKKVEFAVFDGLPHLMINEIIADAQKAVTALNWAIKEMERRYLLFEQKTRAGCAARNVDEYNSNLTEDEQKLPKIVIVVDELADLMSVAKKEIEERIQRLTQKARAAGIHLVIATQRPSVDVITGVIKGNLPTRIAFRVIQEVDSRTILDESGAEKLLGNGDMLYKTSGMFNCKRVQGAFIHSREVQAIVEEIKANNEAYFDSEVADYINNSNQSSGGADRGDGEGGGEVDPVYIRALGIVVQLGSASISLIQRKCSVGYNHAGKIIEWMEREKYITPFDGKAKARTVLLTKEEFESLYGSLD